MLDPAVLAIAALVLVVVVSCTTRVNPGLLAIVLAWLIGVCPPSLCERPVGLKVVDRRVPVGSVPHPHRRHAALRAGPG